MISLKQVVNDLKKILHSNENVVIACSGGPDSMCLVSLLLQIQKEKKIINNITKYKQTCNIY